MHILFDLYTTQIQVGGSAEYVRRVFYALADYVNTTNPDTEIVGFVDSSLGRWAYKDLTPDALETKGVRIADYAKSNIKTIIEEYNIDKVFIGCGQFWGNRFDVENITCPCVCVIHDLQDEEFATNKMHEYFSLNNWKRFMRLVVSRKLRGNYGLKRLPPIFDMAKRNEAVKIVSVSEYSRNSIVFNFGYPREKIYVLFSPERITDESDEIDSPKVQELIDKKRKYYLMLSANRPAKNAEKVFVAFKRYQELTGGDCFIVTTGYKEKRYNRHIPMPYLSDSDLNHVMKHCYALVFASFFEGFGYPAVEAMKYGKPVLGSNVTSLPEVLGDAPIYFSPLYETDIFSALCKLDENNYSVYVKKSIDRYKVVNNEQNEDLVKLIQLILN